MSTPLRVLLVDDSDDDVALELLELKRAGYAVESERVETPDTMLTALRSKAWDLVLSDHSMPRFNAEEALQVLRSHDPEMPFILVSASIGESLVVSIMKSGASDYIRKDELVTLGPAIDRALREAAIRREHRRAVEALRESEERFALAVRGSRDGLWDLNLVTRQIYLSPRLKEMIGYRGSDSETRLEDLIDLIDEEDREVFQRCAEAHLKRRVPFEIEFRGCTQPGGVRWYSARGQALWDEHGTPMRMAGSLSDLTARKRTEEALKEQLELTQRQQEAIRKLSTPIIEVWHGVLTVPVIGEIDEKTVAQMMDTLLAAVSRARSAYVIVDLTAVVSVTAATADHLIKLISAVALLGARGVVVGIQPRVAQAIVAIGVDLASIKTLANLREALVYCMRDKAKAG